MDISTFTSDDIDWLAQRGFDLIREGRPQEADALWDEFDLREFFTGTD